MLSITLKCSYYIVNYKSISVAPLRALEAHNCVKQLYGHSIPFMLYLAIITEYNSDRAGKC